MTIKLSPIIVFASLVFAASPVTAQSLVDGSAEAGKARAITCAACHGAEGNSSNTLWPNLAGQGAPYTVDQLKAFKEGRRQNPLMSSQAMMLSDEDMANLAVYYESLPAAAQAVADPGLIDRGQALYRGGNKADAASACLACHGPTGRGNPAAKYPALNGQHAAYTAKQLRDYRDGTRQTDGKTRVMRDIAAKLDNDDILALSSYIQGLK